MPRWRRLLAQFADPLVYLLLAAMVVSFVAWLLDGADGPPFQVIVIGVIVLINAVLGYVAGGARPACRRRAAADRGGHGGCRP